MEENNQRLLSTSSVGHKKIEEKNFSQELDPGRTDRMKRGKEEGG